MMNWLLDQCFPAETHALAVVRARVREVCQRVGGGDAWEDAVVLAVNEACMNVIQHGYGPAGGGELLLRLGVDDDVFVVQLLDNGRPVADADLCPRPLDEIRPGGLGVRFMRELMDDLAYIEAPAGFVNCLQLRKRIS